MKGHGTKMPRKQGLAISAFLEAPTTKEAARAADVGESTGVWRGALEAFEIPVLEPGPV